jgi:large subunit ribosomal protein L25
MELVANKREITGKKVKVLRRQGITPINLFGHNIEPQALQCDTSELRKALAYTGTTGLLDLKISKEKQPRNVMFREVQKNALTGEVLHADVYQVNMNEKVRVIVPVVVVGDSPALKLKENYLAHEMNNLTIECLPGKIPQRIEVDITPLTEVGQAIHVKDINLGEGISLLNNPEQAVAKISLRFVEKVVTPEAAAAEAAPAEGEAAAAAEGEAKEGEAKAPAK